jgi:hypothetical protein
MMAGPPFTVRVVNMPLFPLPSTHTIILITDSGNNPVYEIDGGPKSDNPDGGLADPSSSSTSSQESARALWGPCLERR